MMIKAKPAKPPLPLWKLFLMLFMLAFMTTYVAGSLLLY
jgi:hypothetical protein